MSAGVLTNAELVVLSLVYERPRHGYEVEQEITRRNMRAWTELSTSSIYYVLGRLSDKGAIEEVAATRGTGTLRRVYRITQHGEGLWRTATMQALSRPTSTYTSFLMGLHNLWNVDPAEALVAVRSYREWLSHDLERQRAELESFGESYFPLDVLFEYGFVLGHAELGFLNDLIARLQQMAGTTAVGKDKPNLEGDGQNDD